MKCIIWSLVGPYKSVTIGFELNQIRLHCMNVKKIVITLLKGFASFACIQLVKNEANAHMIHSYVVPPYSIINLD